MKKKTKNKDSHVPWRNCQEKLEKKKFLPRVKQGETLNLLWHALVGFFFFFVFFAGGDEDSNLFSTTSGIPKTLYCGLTCS